MPEIFTRQQIEQALQGIDVTVAIEEGFIVYSNGKTVVPPVGQLVFDDPPGDVHIKYGYIKNDDYFVIKVASGFYGNVALGLSPADGLMLVFSQKTAQLECILLDECHLTNVRTAAAGAVVAKYLAPEKVEPIGVLGAGIQGKMQVEAVLPIVDCREVVVWGTSEEEVEAYEILGKADLVVADSIEQCRVRGEIYHAMTAGVLEDGDIFELGNVIGQPSLQRTADSQITVADLTGVAVQDIQISKAVYQALGSSPASG